MTMDISVQDVYEFWRYTTLVLSVMALVLTLARTIQIWALVDVQTKFGFLACNFFCVSFIWGIGELLYKGVPAGPRSVVAVIPLFWLVLAGLIPISKGRMASMRRTARG